MQTCDQHLMGNKSSKKAKRGAGASTLKILVFGGGITKKKIKQLSPNKTYKLSIAQCGKSTMLKQFCDFSYTKRFSKNMKIKDKIFDAIIQSIHQLIHIAISQDMQVSFFFMCFVEILIANLRKNKTLKIKETNEQRRKDSHKTLTKTVVN